MFIANPKTYKTTDITTKTQSVNVTQLFLLLLKKQLISPKIDAYSTDTQKSIEKYSFFDKKNVTIDRWFGNLTLHDVWNLLLCDANQPQSLCSGRIFIYKELRHIYSVFVLISFPSKFLCFFFKIAKSSF